MKRTLAFLLCAILMLSCLPIVSAGAKDVGVETKFRMLLEDMEPVANVHRSDRYFFEQIGQYPAQDPEWILIRGGLYDLSANGDIQYQYAAFGNKFLRANTNSSPFSLGYGVFDVKTNVFYDLVDAWDMNLNNLREVWDELAPAVPYDEKDKSSENGMYVIGDADVDGEVTILDATRIQRCLAELDENPWESFTATGADFVRGTVVAGATDYDRDGDTTVMDATRIQRNIADLPNNIDAKIISDDANLKFIDDDTITKAQLLTDRTALSDFSKQYTDQAPDEKYNDAYFKDHTLIGVYLRLSDMGWRVYLDGAKIDLNGTLTLDFTAKNEEAIEPHNEARFILVEISSAFNDDIKDVKATLKTVQNSEPKGDLDFNVIETYRPNLYGSAGMMNYTGMVANNRLQLDDAVKTAFGSYYHAPGSLKVEQLTDSYFVDNGVLCLRAYHGDGGSVEVSNVNLDNGTLTVTVDRYYQSGSHTLEEYPVMIFLQIPKLANQYPVQITVNVQDKDVDTFVASVVNYGSGNPYYNDLSADARKVDSVRAFRGDYDIIAPNRDISAYYEICGNNDFSGYLAIVRSVDQLNHIFPDKAVLSDVDHAKYNETYFKDKALVVLVYMRGDYSGVLDLSHLGVVGNRLYGEMNYTGPLVNSPAFNLYFDAQEVKKSDVKDVTSTGLWSIPLNECYYCYNSYYSQASVPTRPLDLSGYNYIDAEKVYEYTSQNADVDYIANSSAGASEAVITFNRDQFELLNGKLGDLTISDKDFNNYCYVTVSAYGKYEGDTINVSRLYLNSEKKSISVYLSFNMYSADSGNPAPAEDPHRTTLIYRFSKYSVNRLESIRNVELWRNECDYEYEVNADGDIEITKYIGFGENISVPASIDGKKVVAIGNSAFEGKSVKNVTIPESVTSIGSYAFRKCRYLEKISMSDKVTSIGAYAFYECVALESFTVPAGVTQIYIGTFSYCPALKSVMMSDNVTYIGKEAFISCRSMERIYISNSVKTIGESAFERCTSLKSLSIPRGVKTISAKIAKNCTALEKVYIATEGYPTDVGIVIPPILNETIGESAFEGCTALTAVTMPVGIKTIGSRAFYGCTALAFIDLPSTITDINDNTFMNCEGLITVRQMGGDLTVKNVYENAFRGCKSLKNIGFTNALSSIGKSAFRDCSALTTLDLKENLKNISTYAFFSCNALKKLTIPKSVTTIYQYSLGYTVDGNNAAVRRSDFTVRGYFGTQAAFYASYYGFDFEPIIEDTALAFTWLDDYSPDIPFGSEEPLGCHITNQAQRTEAIDQLYTVNGEVISRGDKTFAAENFNIYGYKDLIALRVFKGGSNELVMPVKVTITGENELTVDVKRWRSGGEEATPDMRWALQFISIPKLGERYTVKVNVRNDDTYKNYNGFEYDILTDDETGQKYVELLNYRGLEETVIVPDRIERLPVISTAHQLFRGNKIIKKVTMPAGMTTLGSRAFMGCTSLDTVTLPASLQRLEESTFEGCTALRYVYFGDESGESSQTTVIDTNAFLNCTGIFEINLPAKLTAVMNNAFLGCTNLRVSADSNTNGVTLPRTIETISYKSFGYDKDGNKIASFYIYGYSDTAAERYAANNGFSFRKKDNAGPIDFTVDEIYALPEGTQFFGGSQNDCLVTNKADLKQVLDMAFTGVPEAVRDENSHRFKAEDYDDEWYKTHDVIVLHLSTKYIVNQPDINSLVRDESDRLVPTVIWHENGHATRHDFIAILVVDKMDQYFDVSVKTIRDTVSA